MNRTQLSLVLIALVASAASGPVVMFVRLPPPVDVQPRLVDLAAETAAGTLGKPANSSETVDISGTFQTFDGRPGHTASSWPRFRGADFTNIAPPENGSLAPQWPPTGPPVLWSVPLSEGHAGPAVWKGRVYLMDYREDIESDALRCFSIADGKEIWRRSYKAPTKRNHGVSRTVPAVSEKYTVTMGPRCHVMCVDTGTGAFRWGIDLVAEYAAEVPLWYTGQCPLIDDGVAVLAPGGKALMIGVDCDTGRVLWETPNPSGWKMSHSSIMPMTLLGKKTYVYCALGGVAGISAEAADRGALLWESTLWNHSITAPSPVAIDDHRIFLTAGYGGGSMMLSLKPDGAGIVAEPRFVLEKTIFACEQQTPIFYRGYLFGILPKDASALRGQFVCLDTDGQIVWTSGRTERFGLGPFLVADDKIIILNDTGELTLLRASITGYEPLARARVLRGRDAWAPMALADGKLLLRDSENLICVNLQTL